MIRSLEIALEASKQLADPRLIFQVLLPLSDIYLKSRMGSQCEKILRDFLSSNYPYSTEDNISLQSTLASSLLEQGRAKEAIEILEPLLSQFHIAQSNPRNAVALGINLGNANQAVGNLPRALNAFKAALLFSLSVDKEEAKKIEFQVRALIGKILFLSGNPEEGEKEFKHAESIGREITDLSGSGTEWIYFYSLVAKCYSDIGNDTRAMDYLQNARKTLHQVVLAGSISPDVWDSMLAHWSNIYGRIIRIHLKKENYCPRLALIDAESSKGRLLFALKAQSVGKQSEDALSLDRHEEAFEKVKSYVARKPQNYVISLYADEHGLAVFVMHGSGLVTAKWIEEANYVSFLNDHYKPWDKLLRSISSNFGVWDDFGLATEEILAIVGNWLWNSFPQIANGGDEIILIPHRAFRNLPLSHCKLPNGRRLGECFRRVMICPTLYDLSLLVEKAGQGSSLENSQLLSIVDSDGTLPFARLEGLVNSGFDATKMGSEATSTIFGDSISSGGIVLISCHGRFNADNPWRSSLTLGNGEFEVVNIIRGNYRISADLIVLGACETGRTLGGAADEPIGFSGLLIQSGARAVIAPMWVIPDFSSLLFSTKLFRYIKEGEHPSAAVQKASLWLKNLHVSEVDTIIEKLFDQLEEFSSKMDVAELRKELTCERDSLWCGAKQPFESPLYWASFQVTGLPAEQIG